MHEQLYNGIYLHSMRLDCIGGNVTKPPGLEVFKCLNNFGLGIHHERSVLEHGLTQGNTANQKYL